MDEKKHAPAPFQLLSNGFKHGDQIPEKHGLTSGDVSPVLVWSDQPLGTMDFALIMDDIDEPGGTKVHWMLYGLGPGRTGLDAGIQRNLILPDGIRQGRNDFGEIGYHGPDPPVGTSHRYSFKLKALREKLALRAGADKGEFWAAVNAAGVAGTAELVGWYKLADEFGPGIAPKRPIWESASEPTSEKLRARLDALRNDKEFKRLTSQIEEQLTAAYASSPDEVAGFFRKFSFTSHFSGRKVDEYLATIPQPALRKLLKVYAEYATRFRVQLRLETSPLSFKLLLWPDFGEKFHVRIVGDHLEPVISNPMSEDQPYRDSFESPSLNVLEAIQELIDKGQAMYVQIEDESDYSLLKDLEGTAYLYDGVTFFLHNTNPPYLGCIFGEKMSKQLLADMGPSITEFQSEYYHRVSSGRPPQKP